MLTSPSFGQADLTNCERELIHLAGSVQPHGVLLRNDVSVRTLEGLGQEVRLLSGEVPPLVWHPTAAEGSDRQLLVVRSSPADDRETCGLFFQVEGPRLLKTYAVWAGDEHRILFYDSTGRRFQEVRLSESPAAGRMAA